MTPRPRNRMTDTELTKAIDWLYGGHDQFQRDDVLKARVSKILHSDHEQAVRVLTNYARTLLGPPFTIEDVMKFIEFLDYYLDWA